MSSSLLLERNLKRRVIKMLRDDFPKLYFWKSSDRYTAGIADIIGIIPPKGIFFGFELKVGRNTATKLQQHFIDQINMKGGAAWVITSVEQARDLMEKLTGAKEK